MAYSNVVYTGNGTQTDFAVPFAYIRKEHVKCEVNLVNTTFTWVNNSTIRVSPAPASSTQVVVFRDTPITSPLVDYADGSTLVAADLDTSNLQHLYIEQELSDYVDTSIVPVPGGQALDAGTRKIINVVDPTNPQDAATKNYVDTRDALKVSKAGDSMTGALAMGTNKVTGMGDPTAAQDAATKNYVDTNDALKVSKSGDTMSGNLAMGNNKVTGLGTPTATGDAATKGYVDTADALKVSKAGDTMSGALAMGGNKVTGLGTPTATSDATTKAYVDAADVATLPLDGTRSMTGNLNMGGQRIVSLADPVGAQDAVTKNWVETAGASPLVQFRGIYYGVYTGDPTVDPYGNARNEGDLYFNSITKLMRVFDGTNWVDVSANVTIGRFKFTATGGETSKSGADDNGKTMTYDPGIEQVYLNGVLLVRGVEYTATSGSSITGLAALTAGDVLEVIALSEVVVIPEPQIDGGFANADFGGTINYINGGNA